MLQVLLQTSTETRVCVRATTERESENVMDRLSSQTIRWAMLQIWDAFIIIIII